MTPASPRTYTVGNYGDGPLAFHGGEGHQYTNLHGYQFIFQGPSISDDGLKGLISPYNKDRGRVSSKDDIFTWLGSIANASYTLKRHDLVISQRTPKTGQWLLDSGQFQEWEKQEGGCLWLEGIIGAGKSTLASIVVDHLRATRCYGKSACCICIYFCDGDEITLNSIYAYLVYQILLQSKNEGDIAQLKKRYEPLMLKSEQIPPTPEVLLELLKIEAEPFERMFLIVDALDSCQSTSDAEIHHKFVREIRTSLLPSNRWNIIITSRPDMSNECKRKPDLQLKVEAQKDDIKLYVENRIKNNCAMSRFVEDSDKTNLSLEIICNTIMENAQGMFLLAKLHMDCLEDASQMTLGHFQLALETLPTKLTETFDKVFGRITNPTTVFHSKIADKVLSWVLYSAQPITIDEVKHALDTEPKYDSSPYSFNHEADKIMLSCAGIVAIDKTHMILQPIHESVLRYVEDHSILSSDPHATIAQQCLKYLLFHECQFLSVGISKCLGKYPLVKYAAQNWLHHVFQAKEKELLEELAIKLLKRRNAISMYFLMDKPKFPTDITGLHACVFYGMENWAERLIQDGLDINSVDSDGQTALHWAARYNREASIKLLFRYQAEENVQDKAGDTPLHLAVAGAYEGCVQLMIRHGTKLDIWNKRNWTPFRLSIRLCFPNIAAMFVRNQVEVDDEGKIGYTPLQLVVHFVRGNQMLDLVKLMLDNGYDINRRSDGWTVLRHAINFKFEELAIMLLTYKKLDIDLRDQDGGLTPLMSAIELQQNKIVRLLLDHGADINAKCEDGLTPMIQAAKSGNEFAAWLLLEYKAKVDDQDVSGSSALHYAVQSSFMSISWLLVEQGANLNLINKQGETAIYHAIKNRNTSLVWLLIEKGADTGLVGSDGMTAWHLAAQLGDDGIIGLLVLNESKGIDKKDKNGLTALHHAAKRGHANSVKVLIQNGANIDAVDDEGDTGLHHAARQGHDPTIRVFLDQNASLDIRGKSGLTALHHAVLMASDSTIHRLSQKWAILDIPDDDGRTALICAAQRGHRLATLCLVQKGADTDAQDRHGRTAYHHAKEGKHMVIVRLLRDAGR